MEENLKVNKKDNVVYVNKSWGIDKYGGFWKKGDYITEAYIDGELISSEYFYILSAGSVTQTYNPYFEVVSIKLYEGAKYDSDSSKRKFLKVFKKNSTRYVWTELKIKNK